MGKMHDRLKLYAGLDMKAAKEVAGEYQLEQITQDEFEAFVKPFSDRFSKSQNFKIREVREPDPNNPPYDRPRSVVAHLILPIDGKNIEIPLAEVVHNYMTNSVDYYVVTGANKIWKR